MLINNSINKIQMSADYVLSLAYWAIWAVLLLAMVGLTIRILLKGKDSRDMYSIFTFLFMILMLSIRTATIYPIVANNENFNDFDTRWEEIIYSGIPLSLFNLAILIHTFRWFMLEVKLSTGKSTPKVYTILIISTVAVSLTKHVTGICLAWTDNKLDFLLINVYNLVTLYNNLNIIYR